MKGAEYLPSVRRLLRRIDALSPDVVHVQWLSRPELDVRWLRRIASRYPLVFTAHNAMPRRERAYGAWREALTLAARVVVHSTAGGRAAGRVRDRPREDRARAASRLRLAGALRSSRPPGRRSSSSASSATTKGLDVLVPALPEIRRRVPDARLVVAGDPLEPIDARAGARLVALASRTRSSGGSASSPTRRSRRSSPARRRSCCLTARSSPRACSRSPSATAARLSCPTSGPSGRGAGVRRGPGGAAGGSGRARRAPAPSC